VSAATVKTIGDVRAHGRAIGVPLGTGEVAGPEVVVNVGAGSGATFESGASPGSDGGAFNATGSAGVVDSFVDDGALLEQATNAIHVQHLIGAFYSAHMDCAPAISFYEAALDTGTDAGSKVGWLSGESYQLANFVTISEVEGLVDGASVLDVGCGLGALLDYFATIGRRVEYLGIDLSEKLVEAARVKHEGVAFERRDILAAPPARRFDFVVCSGTLNFRIADHERWVTAMIARMYELCEKAVVVNFLNGALPPPLRTQVTEPQRFARLWPEDVARFSRTLTPHVEIVEAWGSTFTVILRRPRASLAELARTLGVTGEDNAALRTIIEVAARRGLFAELRDVLSALPPTAESVEWIARAHARLGDRAKAIGAYERAAALAPTRADACMGLGRLLLDAGREHDALRWFREALARDPSVEEAHYGLVHSLARGGDREGARAAVDAMPAGPLRDVLDARISTDRDAIVAAYERALARAPHFVDAITGLALVREEQGRWRDASELWQRAIGAGGDDPRIREKHARARARA
jgi:tetratricopeptide (TPR) repeat protein